MKALYLYVDKWYIVAVVNSGGVCRPVLPSNKDDRFWLYFYEDVANDEIAYGSAFQSKFRDGEIHYYGDIFSLLADSSTEYIKFNRKQPIVGIFKDSHILDELRDAVGENDVIETYVSFSKDVSLAARHLFLEELKNERFDVKQNVVRIEHLALEYLGRKGMLGGDGYFLVINSCNENLHCSTYQRSGDLFVRNDEEEELPGLGTDVRRRALSEFIVNSINEREQILKTAREKDAEYLRIASLTDIWLPKLNAAGPIPIPLSGITFSNDPHRCYNISVRKAKIDELTASIVRNIIDVVTKFVSNSGVSREHVVGILLIGDTFSNSQFASELSLRFSVSAETLFEKDLPSILSAYSFIDTGQFDAIQSKLTNDAEAELRRIRQLQDQEKMAAEAVERQNKIDEQKRLAKESERKFQEAKEKGYSAELKHDYHAMEEYFGIARELNPDDEEAARKYEDARRLIAEQNVAQDNFKKKIQEAQTALKIFDWDAALQKSIEALGYVPDSAEAARIKSLSESKIKASKAFERYIDRADMFFAQKLYNEALEELNKAQLLDFDDSIVNERIEKVRSEQCALADSIESLRKIYESAVATLDYESAIKASDSLIDIDSANFRQWSERLSELKAAKIKAEEDSRKLSVLDDKIDNAFFDDRWSEVVSLCQEYLAIRKDAKIEDKLSKARNKLKKLTHDETIKEIENFIASGKFDEATQRIKSEKDILSDAEQKNLHKKVFDAESRSIKKPTGFKPSEGDAFFDDPQTKVTNHRVNPKPDDNDFFCDNQSPKVKPQRNNDSHSQDSFFDKYNKGTSSNGCLTNDDFNF